MGAYIGLTNAYNDDLKALNETCSICKCFLKVKGVRQFTMQVSKMVIIYIYCY